VASHTKKDNPAGLPSRPSSPQTTPARRYVLTPRVAGHLEAVEAHESGAAFLRYKEALRPLVEPDSVLFGNCVPVKVLGYSIEPSAAASASPES
jgi:hypothetical protein